MVLWGYFQKYYICLGIIQTYQVPWGNEQLIEMGGRTVIGRFSNVTWSIGIGAMLLMVGCAQVLDAQTFAPSTVHEYPPDCRPAQENGWNTEALKANNLESVQTIAIDRNDRPHIIIGGKADDNVYPLEYAGRTGCPWNFELLETGDSLAMHNSMALDSKGNPHVAYTIEDGPFGALQLRYAQWTGNSWNITQLDSGSNIGQRNSIGIDSNDHPHLTWADPDHSRLKYGKWTGGNWSIEILPFGTFSSSMAIDSKDIPHIVYCDDGDLRHAKWNGNVWKTELVDSKVGRYCAVKPPNAIAIDSNDFVHIAYRDSSYNYPYDYPGLKHANWTGEEWRIELVEREVEGGYRPSNPTIALTSNDLPRISFVRHWGSNYRNNTVVYAEWNGNNWTFDTIGTGGVAIRLGIDSNDYPHIGYTFQNRRDGQRMIYENLYATKAEIPFVHCDLSLDIDPDTLNLKSKGRWITAYLRTEGPNAVDIDAPSLLLNNVIPSARWDIQNDTTLMVKFDRAAVQAILPIAETVDIKVTGQWNDGETFELHDIIRVILPGKVPLTPKNTFRGFESRSYREDATDEVRHSQLDDLYSVTYQKRFMNQQPQRASFGKELI
jgi:hypothetical protein